MAKIPMEFAGMVIKTGGYNVSHGQHSLVAQGPCISSPVESAYKKDCGPQVFEGSWAGHEAQEAMRARVAGIRGS